MSKKRHRWTSVPVSKLVDRQNTTQVCKDCGIYRLNAYYDKIQYYESDGVTPRHGAGPCKQ